MNERIRELAEQAKCYADENSAHYLQNPHWIETFEEKFAELIVKECLDIVNRKEYSYHEADPLWETSQLIKLHFGVEE